VKTLSIIVAEKSVAYLMMRKCWWRMSPSTRSFDKSDPLLSKPTVTVNAIHRQTCAVCSLLVFGQPKRDAAMLSSNQ